MRSLIGRLRCDVARIWAALGGEQVDCVPLAFGPETFLARVGFGVCAECAAGHAQSEDYPLCETCVERWFDATLTRSNADVIRLCPAHKGA